MKIIELYKRKRKPIYSLEVFPPKDGTVEKVFTTVDALKKFGPAFVSVTCRAPEPPEQTILIAQEIKKRFGIEVLVHLICLGRSKEETKRILEDIKQIGIANILVLRGDLPGNLKIKRGAYQYASELVKEVRNSGNFCIGVAGYPEGHPEAPSPKKDLEYLKMKVDSGADFIITQMFFDVKHYLRFVKRVREIGIKVPIISGVMPVESYFQIKKFLKRIKIDIPVSFKRKLEKHKQDKDYIRKISREFTLSMCRKLINEGAPGIHFYALNNSTRTARILEQL